MMAGRNLSLRFVSACLVLCLLGGDTLIRGSEGANILFFIGGISSHSHRVAVQPLANKLAELGHKVTMFTPLQSPIKHPAIVDFSPQALKDFNRPFLDQFGVAGLSARLSEKWANEILKGTVICDVSFMMSQIILTSPELLPWVDKNKFDLVVIDAVANEVAFGLAEAFKAKTILFNPLSTIMMWDADIFGFSAESSWVPTMENNYVGEMTIWERLYNAYSPVYWYRLYQSVHLPRLDQLIRDTLGERVKDMPPLLDVIKKTDLMLINQHYSDHYARAYPPMVIPVGGMHLERSNGTLPADMEKFIRQGGDAGFIYISFGSAIKISTVSPKVLGIFFETIRSSKLRFLWKWEGETPADAPANVYFHKWFPQLDVLAHPKIRGFIMQGGQISMQQAISNGVPLIILPVNGDQDLTGKRLRSAGNGIELEFIELTTPQLTDAVQRLVQEPSFRERAKKLAKACNDRIMSPLDTAVWWTEYVLRTDDTSHLKPLSIHQSWWTRRSLDAYTLVFVFLWIASVVLFIAVKTLLKLVNFFKGGSDKSKKSKQS